MQNLSPLASKLGGEERGDNALMEGMHFSISQNECRLNAQPQCALNEKIHWHLYIYINEMCLCV